MIERRYQGPDRRTVERDFTVIGAGIAGMFAAISAARRGLTVALVNDRPVPGGNASSEIGVGISGACHQIYNPSIYARECGLMEELRGRLTRYSNGGYGRHALLDAVYTDMLTGEPNITVYYNTVVQDAAVQDGCITAVHGYHTKSDIWYDFVSPFYADCSGDGVVAFKAGAAYMQGRDSKADFGEFWAPEEANLNTMGNTLLFETEDMGHPVEFSPPDFAYDISKMDFIRWIDNPKNFRGFNIHGSHWTFEVGGHWDILKDSSKIAADLRCLIYGIWDYVKNSGKYPQAANYALKRVHTMEGTRESRRFIGDHILTENDIEQFVKFEDAVCIGGWPMDIHAPMGIYDPAPASHFIPVRSIYNIPYRSLYTRDVKNLFLAGRDISASHLALGSTRVMATCGCMGQAVGTAAAFCKQDGVYPAKVNVKALQAALIRDDQSIVGFCENLDPGLFEGWSIEASSEKICENPAATALSPLHWHTGISLPVVTETLESISLQLMNSTQGEEKLTVDVLCGSVLESYLPEEKIRTLEFTVPAGFDGWMPLRVDAPRGRDGKVHLVLRQNEALSVYTADTFPHSVITARYYTGDMREGYDHDTHPLDAACGYIGKDHKMAGAKYVPPLCFRDLVPAQPVYRAENVLNGYSRPYGAPNLWISAAGKGQWLRLHSDTPKRIEELQLIFDTGLNTEERRYFDAPELVKDFVLTVNGKTFAVADNHDRLHRFMIGEEVTDISLKILDTCGENAAHLYAVRFF